MNDIKEPNLQKRANNIGIIYVQDVQQGIKIPTIDIGGVVTVKYEGVTIIVKITDKINETDFRGRIIGFEGIVDENYKDLSVNDIIKFYEENIIGYSPTKN